MRSSRHKPQGAILLEAVVGLFLYAIGLVAVLALVATSLSLFNDIRKGFLATRVAREGIEIVFSKHQNHLVCVTAGTCPIANWQNNLIGVFEVDARESDRIDPDKQFRAYSGTSLCAVDTPVEQKGKFTQCTVAGERPLPGSVTRTVTIERIDDEKARATVTVAWDKQRGARASLVLEEMLFAAR